MNLNFKNLRSVEGLDRRIDFNSDRITQISVKSYIKMPGSDEYIERTNQRIDDIEEIKTIVLYNYRKNKTTNLTIEEVIISDGAYCFDYSYTKSLKVIK